MSAVAFFTISKGTEGLFQRVFSHFVPGMLQRVCGFFDSPDQALFSTRFPAVAALLVHLFEKTKSLKDDERDSAATFFSNCISDTLDDSVDERVTNPKTLVTAWSVPLAFPSAPAAVVSSRAEGCRVDEVPGSPPPDVTPVEFSRRSSFAGEVLEDIIASSAPCKRTHRRSAVLQRRPFPTAASEKTIFASHLVRPVGAMHTLVAETVASALGEGHSSQNFGSIVLLASSKMGKTKVPYSLAQTPNEGIIPVLVRVAGSSGLTPPWHVLNELLQLVEASADGHHHGPMRNTLGFALHALLFSAYLEWVLFTWSEVRKSAACEIRTPAFFLEFVVRVLWNGRSDGAIHERFLRLVPSNEKLRQMDGISALGLLASAKERVATLRDKIVEEALAIGVQRSVSSARGPAVVLFVDECSQWTQLTCFQSATRGTQQSNLYGLVGVTEEIKDGDLGVVMMGTTWSFSKALMTTSSPSRRGPTLVQEFCPMEVDDMCSLLDFYFHFGVGGVRTKFPKLESALHLLRGRPSYFVDGVLAPLASDPTVTLDEEGLIALVERVVAREVAEVAAAIEAEFAEGSEADGPTERADFVLEMVLALASHNGRMSTDRFQSPFVYRGSRSGDTLVNTASMKMQRKRLFDRLMYHPGFVIGGDRRSLSVFNEPILQRALRTFVAENFRLPENDPVFRSYARLLRQKQEFAEKEHIFEHALAWYIARPRTEIPSMRALFELPARVWATGFTVDVHEIVFFSRSKKDWANEAKQGWLKAVHPQWTDEMFHSELHALFDWSDAANPAPVLDRVVVNTPGNASGPDLLFFTARELADPGALRVGESRWGSKAVRLVLLQCKSGAVKFATAIRSLNIQGMYATEAGGRGNRTRLIELLLRQDLQILFASAVRIVTSMCPPKPSLRKALSAWNESENVRPIEVVSFSDRTFGERLSNTFLSVLKQGELGMPRKSTLESLAPRFDAKSLEEELKDLHKDDHRTGVEQVFDDEESLVDAETEAIVDDDLDFSDDENEGQRKGAVASAAAQDDDDDNDDGVLSRRLSRASSRDDVVDAERSTRKPTKAALAGARGGKRSKSKKHRRATATHYRFPYSPEILRPKRTGITRLVGKLAGKFSPRKLRGMPVLVLKKKFKGW